MAEPFTIAVPDERLAAIRAKALAFDWSMADAGEWRSGVGLADLRRLVDHWLTRYDWRAQERRLNALPQFTAEVQGQRLHFVHVRGDGSRPPLMLLHGWPGSFLEFEALIAPLVADGHDVVVPSLPGYAFSGRPVSPIGPRQTSKLMHGLIVELFGATRYLVQGGDWGAAIGAWMAHGHPDAVAALHLNMVLVQARTRSRRSLTSSPGPRGVPNWPRRRPATRRSRVRGRRRWASLCRTARLASRRGFWKSSVLGPTCHATSTARPTFGKRSTRTCSSPTSCCTSSRARS